MKYFLVVIGLIFSVNVVANNWVDCHFTKVVGIQSQGNNVLVMVESSSGDRHWKNIGTHAADSTKSYQSIAQQALASGLGIMFRFTSSHNCNAHEFSDEPLALRIYN